ncbi:MAG TPA: hypothetical protein VJM80_06500 [bacterium]|nr:hypothetical protein [bacterium]
MGRGGADVYAHAIENQPPGVGRRRCVRVDFQLLLFERVQLFLMKVAMFRSIMAMRTVRSWAMVVVLSGHQLLLNKNSLVSS